MLFQCCRWCQTWMSLLFLCLTCCLSHPLILCCCWDEGFQRDVGHWPCILMRGCQPWLDTSWNRIWLAVVLIGALFCFGEPGSKGPRWGNTRNTREKPQCDNQPWRWQKLLEIGKSGAFGLLSCFFMFSNRFLVLIDSFATNNASVPPDAPWSCLEDHCCQVFGRVG